MYNKQKIEERDLLQELKNGNSLAFQKLYNTYFALLYLHATNKLQDREAAKDIVHDLFASIWQNRYTLAIQGEISAYLHSAIRYRVIDHIAKEQSKTKYLASYYNTSYWRYRPFPKGEITSGTNRSCA